MNDKLDFDERASQRNEAIHMTADMKNSRGEVLEALELRKGDKVLDVGSGAGYLALEMAEIVGSSGRVCGLDVSEAQKKCGENGVPSILGQSFMRAMPTIYRLWRASSMLSFQHGF